MSCDVGPGSLATTSTPSIDSATLDEHRAGRDQNLFHGVLDRQLHRRTGRPRVATATKTAGQHGRVRSAGPRAHTDLGTCRALAEDDHDLAAGTLADKIAEAFGVLHGGT